MVLIIPTARLTAAQVAPYESEIDALLDGMSLDDKIGQMVQIDLSLVAVPNTSPIQLDPVQLRDAIVTHRVGSIFNNGVAHALTLDEWHSVLTSIQDVATRETEQHIPILYGIDSIHGASYTLESTLFPQHLALAATRNPELVRSVARVSAMETRASGIRWVFAPVMDIGRQPYWARFPETYGEDPYLAGVLGAAEIRGFQGDDVGGIHNVAACMKHFLGYSQPFSGKDRSPALIPDAELREYHLPPFRAAVRAGVKTAMINSGEVNGVPVHASKYLLTDVLRGELGFDGIVVSDWEDVIRLHTWHAVADSPKEAVRLAVTAGLDMSMVPLDYSFFTLLKELVEEGTVSEERIDASVRRILRLKYETGLFENPYPEPGAKDFFGRPEYRELAYQAASEAMTLLKNEGDALPLAEDQSLLVVGPAADSMTAMNSGWSYTWQGDDPRWYPQDALTIVNALREKLGSDQVLYRKGVEFDGTAVDVEAAVADAGTVDAVVLCLGEEAYCEGPGDIHSLDLPAGQLDLAERLHATGKPVILVLVEGRGRIIHPIEPLVPAILMAYCPGLEGGRAVADVLFGAVNPSGKLPFTYNRHSGNLLTYDRKYTSRLNEISAPGEVRMNPASPQYEFGHGLSYTTFEVRNLAISDPTLRGDGKAKVTVDVSNTGDRAGQEVVELHTRDLFASVTPAGRRLRGFQKVYLKPGETKQVEFVLEREDLSFVNAASRTVTEPGEFEVMVSDLSVPFRYEKALSAMKAAATPGSEAEE